jgi:hypothetical protein
MQMLEKKVWAHDRSGVRGAAILELGEHVPDFVALSIERLVIGQRDFPLGS